MAKKKAEAKIEETTAPETEAAPEETSGPKDPPAKAKKEAAPPALADMSREDLVKKAQDHVNSAVACLLALEKHHDRYAKARVRLAEAGGAIR